MVHRSLLVYCFFLLFSSLSSCQSNSGLTIGQKAPEVNIKNWLKENPNLEGKVIVLDFWFVNCAPCVASIPHLNELSSIYSNEDIVFLAITHDSKDKIEAFMKSRNLSIESHVGLDPKHRNAERFGVKAFPQSYVIDKQGELKWSGSPLLLTTDILNDALGTNKTKPTNQIVELRNDQESLVIRKTHRTTGGNKLDRLKNGKTRSIFLSNSLAEFIASLSDYGTSRIEMKDSIDGNKYDITYESFVKKNNGETHNKYLIDLVLNSLEITSEIKKRTGPGLKMEILNAKKLKASRSSRRNFSINNYHVKGAITMTTLIKLIEEKHGLLVESHVKGNQRYKFDLDVSSLAETTNILEEEYGLSLTHQNIEVDQIILSKKN